MNTKLATAIKYWGYVAPVMKYPSNRDECDKLIEELDELLDIVGSDENHRLKCKRITLTNLIYPKSAAKVLFLNC